ncbi:MAG TPA: right-handed parallel beta-helix repeat-containing protein [Candidatus Acetothermia bacterium]|nr:right-handed parallel beta-helix repeat-containing protein [Candidatus Acetothermia bacterium]
MALLCGMLKEKEEIMRKAMAVSFLLMLVFCSATLAREIVVTSSADNGAGTLRWALQTARSGNTITFDPNVFPPENPATIYPRSELPPINCGNLTIDASNAGVIIDGTCVPGDWNNGLQLYSDHNTVMGLQIVNFTGSGIAIGGASWNTIGGDRGIGSGALGQGNLVSGNGIGIDICDYGTSHNVVQGNLIGTDIGGTTAWGNHERGVWIEEGCSHNTIGPNNIIAFNEITGVLVTGATSNRITQNSIHSNGGEGIALEQGGNDLLEAPLFLDFNLASGVVSGITCANCEVEIFSDEGGEGKEYEGKTIADASGAFVLASCRPLSGPHLTATTTDNRGNTSGFSIYTIGERASTSLQEGSKLPIERFRAKNSQELADNRIGTQLPSYRWEDVGAAQWIIDLASGLGLKWNHLSFDAIEPWSEAPSEKLGISIREVTAGQEHLVAGLRQHGIQICYVLEYWDESMLRGVQEEATSYSRFRTEHEVQQYIDYIRYLVHTLRGQVAYYEILNEPDVQYAWNWVRLGDYIHLVERAIPVIREEDPDAKIVIGATSNPVYDQPRKYLFGILNSSVVADADAISFHPMYGASPAYAFYRDYYYSYPVFVEEVRRVAASHGFEGEVMATEMCWRTSLNSNPDEPWVYSDVVAAKYYARGMTINLGMDLRVGVAGELFDQIVPVVAVIRNLCTVMAGHKAIDMPAKIDIDYEPVAYCGFRYPNGDRILAIWTDGIAQDEDPGVPTTITIPGLKAGTVSGIDVLHGFEQELVSETDGDSTIVRDLLVKDYPILIRLSDVTMSDDYVETVGDGFHRLGDVDAVPRTSGGSDRDGDGVPDAQDYCPDWPGSKEANGC